MVAAARWREEAPDLGHGQRDHPGVGRRRLIGPDRRGRPGAGAVLENGGGDGADRERGHDQDHMAQDREVETEWAAGLECPSLMLPLSGIPPGQSKRCQILRFSGKNQPAESPSRPGNRPGHREQDPYPLIAPTLARAQNWTICANPVGRSGLAVERSDSAGRLSL